MTLRMRQIRRMERCFPSAERPGHYEPRGRGHAPGGWTGGGSAGRKSKVHGKLQRCESDAVPRSGE